MARHRNIHEQYQYYCAHTIEGLRVPKEQFKKVLGRFSILIMDKLLEAEEVKLPIIGTLRIKKIKQKFTKNKLKIDYQETKKLGKIVYHLNDHRDGHFYRFMWSKNKITGIGLYSFTAERHHCKRRLAKLLKTDSTKDFFEN